MYVLSLEEFETDLIEFIDYAKKELIISNIEYDVEKRSDWYYNEICPKGGCVNYLQDNKILQQFFINISNINKDFYCLQKDGNNWWYLYINEFERSQTYFSARILYDRVAEKFEERYGWFVTEDTPAERL